MLRMAEHAKAHTESDIDTNAKALQTLQAQVANQKWKPVWKGFAPVDLAHPEWTGWENIYTIGVPRERVPMGNCSKGKSVTEYQETYGPFPGLN